MGLPLPPFHPVLTSEVLAWGKEEEQEEEEKAFKLEGLKEGLLT